MYYFWQLRRCLKKKVFIFDIFVAGFTYINIYFFLILIIILFFPLKESEIQLGPGDCGDDSRLFLLGLHSHSDTRRLHLFETGC